MAGPHGYGSLGEIEQVDVDVRPVDPGDLVVLAVGVVVALLRSDRSRRRQAAAGRRTTSSRWRSSPATDAAVARRSLDRRSDPRRRCSMTGCRRSRRGCPGRWLRCACRRRRRGRGSVNPSCTVMRLTDADGRRREPPNRSAEPVKPCGEVAEQTVSAAPEVAHRVAVLPVPLAPQRRELPEAVAVHLPDVPRFGDQLGPGHHRVLGDEVEERRGPVEAPVVAGQCRGEIEAEAVDVHLADPVPQRVHDESQGGRAPHVEGVAATRRVDVPAGSCGSRR